MKPTAKQRMYRGASGAVKIVLAGLVVIALAGCTVVHTVPDTLPGPGESLWNTYFMQQRFWSLADSFVIRDDTGRAVFRVEGKPFSLGDRLRFYDMHGVEHLYIKQRLFSLRHLFRIYKGRRLYAKMTKRLRVFNDKFVLDVPGPHDYVIRGNLTNYRYRIYRDGHRVAEIAKRLPAWGDQYRVRILAGEDDIVLLAAAVIVDMVSHRGDRHHPLVHVH